MLRSDISPRYQIENLGMATQITIPAKKNWLPLIFLAIWLTGWLCGELFALGVLLSSVGGLLAQLFGFSVDFIDFDSNEMGGVFVMGFMLVWLIIWTYGGYSALRTFLWQLAGKEIVEASRMGIKLSRLILGLGRVKEYQAGEIADLRLLEDHERIEKKTMAGLNMLAFDYEFDTVEFGGGLTPAEAKGILEEITKRYRQYMPVEPLE
jgi:hypothetical protein